MNLRADNYRFVGMSYADVLKCKNINKGVILHSNGLLFKSCTSAAKHADNTRVYKIGVISKPSGVVCQQLRLWDAQNSQKFGFIPISNLALPNDEKQLLLKGDLLSTRYLINKKGKHNFLGAQIEIPSQLNPDVWQKYLGDYLDKQLPMLIRYGFPLDFDHISLSHTGNNHPSTTQHLTDVRAYLDEDASFNALLHHFATPPLPDLHLSPFMTREKPGSKNRRVIIDLSYPYHH